MNLEKLKQLKDAVVAHIEKFATVKEKFMDAKLNDGVTVVRFPNDMIAKGDAVTVITDQGELPLPDNSPENPIYTLEDGSTFTVLNGVVDMYTEAETEEETTPEAGVEEPMQTEAKPATAKEPKRVIKSQVEEHVFNTFKKETEEMFLALKEEINVLNEENKSLKEQLASQFNIQKELVETVNFIADQPSTESVEKKKTVSKKFEEMTALEKHRYLKSLSK